MNDLRLVTKKDLDYTWTGVPLKSETTVFVIINSVFTLALAMVLWGKPVNTGARAFALLMSAATFFALAFVTVVELIGNYNDDPHWQVKKRVTKYLKLHPELKWDDWLILSDFKWNPRIGMVKKTPRSQELLDALEGHRKELAGIPQEIEFWSLTDDYTAIDKTREKEKELKRQLIDDELALEDFIFKYGREI